MVQPWPQLARGKIISNALHYLQGKEQNRDLMLVWQPRNLFKKLPISSNKMLNQLDFKFKMRMWSLQVLLILRKKEYIPLIGTCGCSQSSMHLILTAVSHQEEAQLLYSHVRGLNRELSIFRSLHNNHIYYGKKQTNPKHTTIITEHLLCPSPFARKGRLHKLCP